MSSEENKLSKEKEFHDKRFSNDDARQNKVSKFYKISHKIFEKYEKLLIENGADKSVLEYGCGLDNYIFKLAKYSNAKMTGIDISSVAIEKAAAKAKDMELNDRVSFLTMNAEDLKFPDGCYDLVFGVGILHHLNLEKAINSIVRVLKTNGKAIFIEPLGHNFLINHFRRNTPSIRTEDEHPLLNKDLALIKKHFKNVNFEYYYLSSLAASFFSGKPFFKFLLRSLELLDSLIFMIPFFRKYAWMVLIVVSDPVKAD